MYPLNNKYILDVATEAAISGARIVMDALGSTMIANHKGRTDLVTDIDRRSEQVIKSLLRKQFPDHDIVAEESGSELMESDYCWFIDPLDGTTNFVHGYPSFGISIGLFHNNKPQVGVVMEMPAMNLYTATAGTGSYCNNIPIHASLTDDLVLSLLVTGFGYEHGINWEKNMLLFKQLTDITQGVRRLGAAAVDLCHVASGMVDGFWEFDLKPWDTAAGILIAIEAGANVSRLDGSEYSIFDDQILVTNGIIHQSMVDNIIGFL
jgi:myo-inositol-1(or 4)-monophosphatase